MSNPCYKGPGYKCPRRSAECRRTCEDWIKYETQHMAELKERQKIYEKAGDYNDFKRKVRYASRTCRRNTGEVADE